MSVYQTLPHQASSCTKCTHNILEWLTSSPMVVEYHMGQGTTPREVGASVMLLLLHWVLAENHNGQR